MDANESLTKLIGNVTDKIAVTSEFGEREKIFSEFQHILVPIFSRKPFYVENLEINYFSLTNSERDRLKNLDKNKELNKFYKDLKSFYGKNKRK